LNVLLSIIIVLLAVVIGAVLVFSSGQNPITAYATIFSSTFGSTSDFLNTFELSAPLILVTLGLLLAFRTSFWNGGGEGQMLLGGLAGIAVTHTLNLGNSFVMITAGLVCAFLVGGAWAALSGAMKVWFNVDDIVSSLLLSVVASYLVSYLVRIPFRSPNSAESAIISSISIPNAAVFPTLFGLNTSIWFALTAAVVMYYVLSRTKFGFMTKVIGSNRQTAAAYFGKSRTNWMFVLVTFLSGGIIGLGGMVNTTFTSNIIAGASGGAYSAAGFTSSYGFIGIAIAFLAQLNPIAVIPGSIFFVALVTGGLGLSVQLQIPASLTVTISGMVVLVLSLRETIVKRLSRFGQRPSMVEPTIPERG